MRKLGLQTSLFLGLLVALVAPVVALPLCSSYCNCTRSCATACWTGLYASTCDEYVCVDHCRGGSVATFMDEPIFECESVVAVEASRYENSLGLFDSDLVQIPSPAAIRAVGFSNK